MTYLGALRVWDSVHLFIVPVRIGRRCRLGAVKGGVGGLWETVEIAQVLSDSQSFILQSAHHRPRVDRVASKMNGQVERQEGLLTLQ